MQQLVKIEKVKELAPKKIEVLILEHTGIKVLAKKENGKLYLICSAHRSCYNIMEKLRYDFDFSVHKKGNYYLLEI
jgi:hypothetical protein